MNDANGMDKLLESKTSPRPARPAPQLLFDFLNAISGKIHICALLFIHTKVPALTIQASSLYFKLYADITKPFHSLESSSVLMSLSSEHSYGNINKSYLCY